MKDISVYLSYPFVRYAIIVGILIALCSSLLGVILVLKRFSFIGDGLSHVAFGAVAVSTVFNLTDNMVLVLPVTIIAAILLLKGGANGKIKGDASITMMSVGAMAFGYLVMNVFSSGTNLAGDVCTTLFGSTSILTLTKEKVVLCVILSVVVIATFILFYNKIFAVTFDENFASATGMDTKKYNLLIAVIIAIIVVLAMNLVGSLLISALVVFPALASMCVFKSFLSVTISSAVFSVVCTGIGLFISVLTNPTTGGVSASFASLGDITIAEPKALICFAGPRVIEQTIGEKLPEGFQRAEFLLEHGRLDAVVERKDLKNWLSTVLKLHNYRR